VKVDLKVWKMDRSHCPHLFSATMLVVLSLLYSVRSQLSPELL
jgi:hypothetical protein